MSPDAIGKALAGALASAVRWKRRKDRRARPAPGAVSAWEAMILQQAGPMRDAPVRPARQVKP